MADIVMACIVMACIVMVYIVMAYIAMAYIVVAEAGVDRCQAEGTVSAALSSTAPIDVKLKAGAASSNPWLRTIQYHVQSWEQCSAELTAPTVSCTWVQSIKAGDPPSTRDELMPLSPRAMAAGRRQASIDDKLQVYRYGLHSYGLYSYGRCR